MPKFIHTTDRLLSDPELLKQSQMDIQVQEEEATTKKDINDDEEIKEPPSDMMVSEDPRTI